ncbi:MAG: CaiB/BaiF CoA transferase family protein [Thiolinea sp.]
MRPFQNIRVLDFTHVFAGPFATFQLGVLGAEIIKIEPPHTPDMMRSWGANPELNKQGLGLDFQVNNQGKKAITLNLDTPEGQEIIHKMIPEADVIVENYSDGLVRYGLSPDEVMQLNPRIIYCQMTAYGKGENNEFEGRPAFDPVVQAFAGLMANTGEEDQDILRINAPLIDYGTGAQAAFAIASALFQRSQTGKGQHIEVNMIDACLMMMSPQVASAIHTGKPPAKAGNVRKTLPGYSMLPCKTGHIQLGAFTLRQNEKLFDALELATSIAIPEPLNYAWMADNGKALLNSLCQRLASESAEYWEEFLNRHDVPASRVRELDEVMLKDQPRRESGNQFQRTPGSEVTSPITAFRYVEHGPDLDVRCAAHGENTVSVLQEFGYSEADIATLREKGVV